MWGWRARAKVGARALAPVGRGSTREGRQIRQRARAPELSTPPTRLISLVDRSTRLSRMSGTDLAPADAGLGSSSARNEAPPSDSTSAPPHKSDTGPSTDQRVSLLKRAPSPSTSSSLGSRPSSGSVRGEVRFEHDETASARLSPAMDITPADEDDQPSQLEPAPTVDDDPPSIGVPDVVPGALDEALFRALSHPRDRLLLLRTEIQLHAFLDSPK